MRQSAVALCRIQRKSAILELQLEAFLAEVEFYRLAFLAAFPDGLEPLGAALAVGRFVPDERHRFPGFDSVADVEVTVFLAVRRDENLADFLLRSVVDFEGVTALIRAASDRRNKSGDEQSAADEQGFFHTDRKLHDLVVFGLLLASEVNCSGRFFPRNPNRVAWRENLIHAIIHHPPRVRFETQNDSFRRDRFIREGRQKQDALVMSVWRACEFQGDVRDY